MTPDPADDMSPWDAEHARRVLERIGRAQVRARHAEARHAEAMEHADAADNDADREFYEREASQHLSAKFRQEEAVEIQMEHLRHLFGSEAAFRHWLDEHDPEQAAEDADS